MPLATTICVRSSDKDPLWPCESQYPWCFSVRNKSAVCRIFRIIVYQYYYKFKPLFWLLHQAKRLRRRNQKKNPSWARVVLCPGFKTFSVIDNSLLMLHSISHPTIRITFACPYHHPPSSGCQFIIASAHKPRQKLETTVMILGHVR